MSESLKLPSKVENFQDFYNDDRFIKVKLSLCTHEQVANMMKFPRELLESKMYQIDYMPIYGLIKIKENEDGTVEYIMGNHETEYAIDCGELKITSKTVILGVALPNTRKFEYITRNGDTKEYITFEALLYVKKYPQLKTIISEDIDASMEISDVEKHWSEGENCYVIDDFSYDAHCLLGDAPPAFKLAGVLERFSLDSFKSEFEELLKEVKFSLNNIKQYKEGGDEKVENETKNIEEVVDEVNTETNNSDMSDQEKAEDVVDCTKDNEDDKKDEDMAKKKKCEEDVEETNKLKDDFEEVNSKYDALMKEYSELKLKYDDVNSKYTEIISKQEYDKKVEVVNTFRNKLTNDEIQSVIDDVDKFSISEIDTALTLELGRKAKLQEQNEEVFSDNKEDSTYEFLDMCNFSNAGNTYFSQLAKKIKNQK